MDTLPLEELLAFLQQFGYVGMFLLSLVGALSLIVPIPYTLIIYTMGGILDPLPLAISAGLGSAVGEFSGYALGYFGKRFVRGQYERRLHAIVRVFDRYGPLAIFVFALTPLPDDLLFIPLGLLRYSFVKAFIPCLVGKFSMCLILAYGGYYSIEIIRRLFLETGWSGVAVSTIVLVIILVIMIRIDWERILGVRAGNGWLRGSSLTLSPFKGGSVDMKARVHVIVSGRVQGVFFRSETEDEANRLGVRGWVRNLRDGRVEGVFEGDRDKVEKLIEFCRRGPPAARVTDIEVSWEEYRGEFEDFRIRYGYY